MDEAQHDQCSSEERAYGRYRTAVEACSSLTTRIQSLAKTEALPSEVQSFLRACGDGIKAQEAANQELLNLINLVHRKPPNAANLAAKVFETPELLEHILASLSISELLGVYSVSKTFCNTIEGSLALQRLLGLEADPRSHYYIPAEELILRAKGVKAWNSIDLLNYNLSADLREDAEDEFKVMIDMDSHVTIGMGPGDSIGLKLPNLGSRCARVLVSQPPPKEVLFYAHCCTRPAKWLIGSGVPPNEPTTIIRSDVGVTLGQVYETVDNLRKEHSGCVHSDWREHDAEGFIHASISIQGPVKLRDDDPVFSRKQELMHRNAYWKARKTKMLSYWRAKKQSQDSGNPIPTLAEFEAAQQGGQS